MKFIFAILTGFVPSAWAYVSVYPSSVSFYSVVINSSAPSQRVDVRNSGADETRVSVSNTCFGDFQVSDYCQFSLAPGASCSLDVRFSPRREGLQSCSIWVRDAAGGSSSVNVQGEGIRR